MFYQCWGFLIAKAEEELQNGLNANTKLTNQMFVAAAKDEDNLNSLNAATFVSVVSNNNDLKSKCSFFLFREVIN